jgi:hypothetical protein
MLRGDDCGPVESCGGPAAGNLGRKRRSSRVVNLILFFTG